GDVHLRDRADFQLGDQARSLGGELTPEADSVDLGTRTRRGRNRLPRLPHSPDHSPDMTLTRTSTVRWLGALIALVAVAGLWYVLAPGKLGGSHEYAVIDGTSMNPKLHAGDLVLLHPASS